MNIRKIIKEEVDSFEWVKGIDDPVEEILDNSYLYDEGYDEPLIIIDPRNKLGKFIESGGSRENHIDNLEGLDFVILNQWVVQNMYQDGTIIRDLMYYIMQEYDISAEDEIQFKKKWWQIFGGKDPMNVMEDAIGKRLGKVYQKLMYSYSEYQKLYHIGERYYRAESGDTVIPVREVMDRIDEF